jgi:hypothetical protein
MTGVSSGEVTGVILSCVAIGFMVAVYYALQVRAGFFGVSGATLKLGVEVIFVCLCQCFMSAM